MGNGVEDVSSEEAQKCQGYENYTFKKVDNGTELSLEQDVPEDYRDYFEKSWEASLHKIKEIAER